MTLARRISLLTSVIIVITTALFATLAAFSSRNTALDAVDARLFELRDAISDQPDPVSALLESLESSSPNFVASLVVPDEDPIPLTESAGGETGTISPSTPVRSVSIDLGNEQLLIFGEKIADIQNNFRSQLLMNSFMALLLAVVGGGVSAVVSRKSLQPIGRIVEFSERVAGGQLDASLDVDSPSAEVRKLQESISSMVLSLKNAADGKARSEEAMREFLADVAHELRTPLTTVRAYADLLATAGNVDAETRLRAQSRIAQESKRMSRLIDDLLLLARLSTTPTERNEEVDVSALVRAHLDDLQLLDPLRPIELHGDSAMVVANRALVERMLANVFSNVHRYTPSTSPLEVRCGVRDGSLEVVIEDGGPGLDEIQLEQLTSGAKRFGLVRGSDQHGTGLGLHLLTSIAHSHGGEVEFRTSRFGGLCIRVAIPVTSSSSSPTADKYQEVLPPSAE